jgi:hypothetical protein
MARNPVEFGSMHLLYLRHLQESCRDIDMSQLQADASTLAFPALHRLANVSSVFFDRSQILSQRTSSDHPFAFGISPYV